MTANIQVLLRGGEYPLTAPVTFDGLDSGTNGYDVIYAAYPGEQPVLHGGHHVTGLDGGGRRASIEPTWAGCDSGSCM